MSGWDQSRLQLLIDSETQESLTLEYKAAEALGKSRGRKNEITKDVSSLANSAGGIIIYGIQEHSEPERKHLPKSLDAVDSQEYPREWLEQVIMNIRPRIDGLVVIPVSLDSRINDVVYVVEVPQSSTAHQSQDYRYYKRHNFMSVPMEDYEIRDVMSRSSEPILEIEFLVKKSCRTYDKNSGPLGISSSFDPFGGSQAPQMVTKVDYYLQIDAVNVGHVFGMYVQVDLDLPYDLLYLRDYLTDGEEVQPIDFNRRHVIKIDNTIRDVIKPGGIHFASEEGPARYVPILPGTKQNLRKLSLTRLFEEIQWADLQIEYVIYCDNAGVRRGTIRICDIRLLDLCDD